MEPSFDTVLAAAQRVAVVVQQPVHVGALHHLNQDGSQLALQGQQTLPTQTHFTSYCTSSIWRVCAVACTKAQRPQPSCFCYYNSVLTEALRTAGCCVPLQKQQLSSAPCLHQTHKSSGRVCRCCVGAVTRSLEIQHSLLQNTVCMHARAHGHTHTRAHARTQACFKSFLCLRPFITCNW